MKQAPKVWDRISPRDKGDSQATPDLQPPQPNGANLDFQAQAFDRRSRRLNTNMARTQTGAIEAAAAQKPPMPAPTPSEKPPASKASQISAKPASVKDVTPASTRSQTSSQRPIRTGGFQKLGAQIVH